MIDIRTGKEMTRRDFGKGIAAILSAGVAPSIAMGLAGSANATVGRGVMRNVGARNAAMSGEALPYDEELEWMQAGNHHYIDSLIIGRSGIRIEYSFSCETNDSDDDIIGCYSSVSGGTRCYTPAQVHGDGKIGYIGAYSFGVLSYRTKHDIVCDLAVGSQIVYLDGQLKYSGNNMNSFNTNYSLGIFSRHVYASGIAEWRAISNPDLINFARIYGRIKFYEGTVKIAEFIPCLVTQVNRQFACYYESVNKRFHYNAGAGYFGYKKTDGTIVNPT